MTSAAQTSANRSNARKSTGPRTPEGKATASRNAVKHGLLAEQVVIHGEDPEEFDLYRAGMLDELAPVGAVEEMLAERAVSLAWRLRRAERLQSAVFATVYRENANDVVLWPKHGLPIKPGPGEEEVVLGQVVMTDFTRAQVLDRLLVYERRIESSLYRTMRELRREREARAAAEPEEAPRSEGDVAAGEEPTAPAELGSFGADAPPERVSDAQDASRADCHVPSDGFDFTHRTSHLELARITPYGPGSSPGQAAPTETGGTTNLPMAENHGRDARATGTLHDRFCETNPIRPDAEDGPRAWGREVRGDSGQEGAGGTG